MAKRWRVEANRERTTLQALKKSDIQAVPLSYQDLANSVEAIDAVANLQQAKAVLKRLLKALAMTYLELERRT